MNCVCICGDDCVENVTCELYYCVGICACGYVENFKEFVN